MPRKIRELIQDLQSAGFYEVSGGKGSHRKFVHTNYAGAVTISGKIGEKMPRFIKKTGSTSLRAGE
ncbi:MAG: type II toxin-antitoxin system HicA family toxin, partial [Gammaproteobacteria bacterium]